MDTHDEETKQFFTHSNVRVRLVYRGWRDQKNLIRCLRWARHAAKNMVTLSFDGCFPSHRSNVVTTTFTHHQKCIILDARGSQMPASQRHVAAFVGGIDLTTGAAPCQNADRRPLSALLECRCLLKLYDRIMQAAMMMPGILCSGTSTTTTSGST